MKKSVLIGIIVAAVFVIGIVVGVVFSTNNDIIDSITIPIPTNKPACKHNDPTQIVVIEAVAPTCQQTGLSDGKKCNLCGTMVVPQSIVNKYECCDFKLNEDGTYSISGQSVNCSCSELVIPNEYNGVPVTSIDEDAFKNCTSLTSVTIPESIKKIGEDAFENCELIRDVYYTGDIENWLEIDFEGYFDYVDWSNSNPMSYGANLYLDGELLTSISIPDSVTSIGNGVFDGCTSLTSITIPNSVTSIGQGAFMCPSLVSISIPDSIISIDERALPTKFSLQFNEYDNALYIGNEDNPYVVLIKAKDTNITDCEIHSDTKIIYDLAFDNCTSLTSINIPDSVTMIGYKAFRYCSSLTGVIIPDSVTSIDLEYGFLGCNSLKRIKFEGTVEQWNAIYIDHGWGSLNYEIVCTNGTVLV